METAARSRPSTSVLPDGSRTMTMTNDLTRHEGDVSTDEGESSAQSVGVLRLRPKRIGNRVAWDEEVVDNEGAGKKKSKICCIYHKPRRYDESSDESSDSSDSDADEHDHSAHSHPHPHPHPHPRPTPNEHADGAQPAPVSGQQASHGEVVHELELPEDEPNAYERPPPKNPGKGKRKSD